MAKLSRPEPALAGADGDVVLGAGNPATGTLTAETRITATINSGATFVGWNMGTTTGVAGASGNSLQLPSYTGVSGRGPQGHTPSPTSPYRGVLGIAGDIGVDGAVVAPGDGIGVRGTSTSGSGVFGQSQSNAGVYGKSTSNAGVFGDSPSVAVAGVTTNGLGVQGTSATNAGVYGQSNGNAGVFGISPYAGVQGASSNIAVWGQTSGGTAVFGQNLSASGWAGQFAGNVYITGSLTVASGAKSAAVKKKDGSMARVYCQESPEPWFEDFGTAELKGGQASVQLDPEFDEVVDGNDYRVFVTATADGCGPLYVSRKGPHRFEVRSYPGGGQNGTFDFRVVARRADRVGGRLEKVEIPVRAAAASPPPQPKGVDLKAPDVKDLPQATPRS